jgi:hypothetical protein
VVIHRDRRLRARAEIREGRKQGRGYIAWAMKMSPKALDIETYAEDHTTGEQRVDAS